MARINLKSVLFCGAALAGLSLTAAAGAQVTDPETTTQPANTPTGAETPDEGAELASDQPAGESIVVTGSRIRQDPNRSSLPLQIVTTQELERNAISSPEQFVNFLTTNGSGSDNLASNSDVVSGQQRGNNGASFANLRGQGSAATLVLLNGRRVASHGLNGAAVDVNQIPFGAIERIEVLKDGASQSTEPTRSAASSTSSRARIIPGSASPPSPTSRMKATRRSTVSQASPVMATSTPTASTSWRQSATATLPSCAATGAVSWIRSSRSAASRPTRAAAPPGPSSRSASARTRRAVPSSPPPEPRPSCPAAPPFARAAASTSSICPAPKVARQVGRQQEAYADDLWLNPTARLACSYDTGRDASLQQDLETLTYLGRGVAKLGDHELFAEVTGSDATAAKRFSNVQITPNTTTQNYAYPSSGDNYTNIFNRLVAVFPTLAPRRGLPIAYRWRCIECGPRQIVTDTKTFRAAIGADGPLFGRWDYRTGLSYAESESNRFSAPAITSAAHSRTGSLTRPRRARPAPPFRA
jgi:iron complex outermembrane receptor protein